MIITITLLSLAAANLVCIYALLKTRKRMIKLIARYRQVANTALGTAEQIKETYNMVNRDTQCKYIVGRIDNIMSDDNNRIAVKRISNACGLTAHYPYISYIKVFTDDDEEFNQREAEELCEKLNEK